MQPLKLILSLAFIVFCFAGYSQKKIRTWSNKNISDYPHEKLLVIGLAKNLEYRYEFEESVVDEAIKNGLKAKKGMTVIPPENKNPFRNMDSIRSILRQKGYNGLMSFTLFSIDSKRYIHPSKEYIPFAYYNRFGSYYEQSYVVVTRPGYIIPERKYFIECNLYEVNQGKLLWSGRSYAFYLAEFDKNLKKFNKAMFKDFKNLKLID